MLPKPLEGVRRGTRLESTAAKDVGTGLGDVVGDAFDLVRRFNGAGTGDDGKFLAANGHAAVTDGNDRILGMERPAGPFVRDFDAHDLVDTFIALSFVRHNDDFRIADEAHDSLAGAFTDIDLQALGLDGID